ncbi:hypothetical protein F5Y03DRAFT_391616 [Xylaria venustula]|nr:hypothetical protein F5Y03DRAFT_391616 [Xylaria venustula]
MDLRLVVVLLSSPILEWVTRLALTHFYCGAGSYYFCLLKFLYQALYIFVVSLIFLYFVDAFIYQFRVRRRRRGGRAHVFRNLRAQRQEIARREEAVRQHSLAQQKAQRQRVMRQFELLTASETPFPQ